MAERYAYPVEFERLDGCVLASLPDWEGCFAGGETEAEALLALRDALMICVFTALDGYEPVPAAGPAAGRSVVAPDPLHCDKLDIVLAMREQGVTKRELARRASLRKRQVQHLIAPQKHVGASVVQAARTVLGL